MRTRPELAKISWINDVEREKDIDHAAETLLRLGLTREQQVWNKKIELSLGKLALMADMADEAEHSVAGGSVSSGLPDVDAKREPSFERIERELSIIKIQDALYSQIFPTISLAIDESAEVELALKAHGNLIPKRQKALVDIFEDAMIRLLKHEALDAFTLIDLLTLSNLKKAHVDEIGDQFFLALSVAESGLKGQDRTEARRLIWRRCYIRDDWKSVNETNGKADVDQLEAVGGTAAYSTMFAIVDYHQSDESFYPLIKPSEVLGVFTEHVDRRFNGMDENFHNRLLDAMRWEDSKLRTYIEKHQLDAWHRTVLEEAEKTVTRAYDKIAEAEAEAKSKVHMNGNGIATRYAVGLEDDADLL